MAMAKITGLVTTAERTTVIWPTISHPDFRLDLIAALNIANIEAVRYYFESNQKASYGRDRRETVVQKTAIRFCMLAYRLLKK